MTQSSKWGATRNIHIQVCKIQITIWPKHIRCPKEFCVNHYALMFIFVHQNSKLFRFRMSVFFCGASIKINILLLKASCIDSGFLPVGELSKLEEKGGPKCGHSAFWRGFYKIFISQPLDSTFCARRAAHLSVRGRFYKLCILRRHSEKLAAEPVNNTSFKFTKKPRTLHYLGRWLMMMAVTLFFRKTARWTNFHPYLELLG